jgi:tRNA threonylcarbamoyladenosine biosynthesis protein TsaE
MTELLSQRQWFAADAEAQEACGMAFARALNGHAVVYLQGDLGAGKTTFTRGVLRAFGHQGAVKSPTYTLVEPYELASCTVFHFDLYRLNDPEELELMGIREYCRPDSLLMVEWPDRGYPFLPASDVVITIRGSGEGREIVLQAHSPKGQLILQQESA